MTGPPQGLELTSSVSKVELYLSASAKAASPAGSILLSLTFRTLSVRFRFSTCAMYVMPFCLISCVSPRSRVYIDTHPDLVALQVERDEPAYPFDTVKSPDASLQSDTCSSSWLGREPPLGTD